MNTDGLTPVAVKDYLEQDAELRGQKFACVSFVSPEDILMTKEPFMFNKFIESMSGDIQQLFSSLKDYFKDTPSALESITSVQDRYSYLSSDKNLKDEFEFFKNKNNDALEKMFLERNAFRTTVRGIKIRGVFETMAEAHGRVDAIRRFDKRHNVYIAEVGCWCPWSPNPDLLVDQQYGETALNSLVKEYNDNLDEKDTIYDDRKNDMMQKLKIHNVQSSIEQADPWTSSKPAIEIIVDDKIQPVDVPQIDASTSDPASTESTESTDVPEPELDIAKID